MPLKDVATLMSKSQRPVRMLFDAAEYEGLTPPEAIERAAQAQGLDTARVTIDKVKGAGGGGSAGCGAGSPSIRSRDGDTVEVEYVATYSTGTAGQSEARRRIEWDSTASRGRPFAFSLGNGDVVRGLEIGT